jgi:UDP-glucuronate decarboxylase
MTIRTTEPYDFDVAMIFNLACAASPVHYQRDPVHTTLTCVQGTHHALLLAERTGARFLQASTSEVYGDPEIHPQPESYPGRVSPIGPRACYDEGKRCAETLIMDFKRSRGVDARIARIFNTYGPSMAIDDGRVISNFIVQALENRPLTVYGDGKQTRSLCYVSDLIDGLMRLIEVGEIDHPVNLGNPREMTILEIARSVIAQVGAGRIEFSPLPEDDPKRRRPDISTARSVLGFSPKVSFEEGLETTVLDFDRRLRSRPRQRRAS